MHPLAECQRAEKISILCINYSLQFAFCKHAKKAHTWNEPDVRVRRYSTSMSAVMHDEDADRDDPQTRRISEEHIFASFPLNEKGNRLLNSLCQKSMQRERLQNL